MNLTNMEKIYSRKEPDKILQILFSASDIPEGGEKLVRQEFTPPESNLQALGHYLSKGNVIKPHTHNPIDRFTKTTQEGIVIIEGTIELSIYDLDNLLIETRILRAGDCALMQHGGHKFTIIDDAKFFEFKNGPYMGKMKDMTPIYDY